MEGEDLMLEKYTKDIKNGFYVDAGCYHPLHLNNTYLLYKKKWSGINIDLSKFSIALFNCIRPNDLNVNAAVSNKNEEVIFYYQKKLSQLTTIKKAISKERMQGQIKEKKIKALSLTKIIDNSKYKNRKIDFLNIDIEGADFEALQSLNFNTYRPKVICVEIIEKNLLNSKIFKYLDNLEYKKIWSSKSNFNHIFIEKT